MTEMEIHQALLPQLLNLRLLVDRARWRQILERWFELATHLVVGIHKQTVAALHMRWAINFLQLAM
jgi:hypothetical protein